MSELIRQNNQTELMPLHDLESYAKYIVASGMFGIQKPEQAIGLMLLCQAEGLNPIQAVRRYHIIQGRPAMRADAMLAEYQARGGSVQWLERTDAACEAVFHHPASGPVNVRWTLDDAKRANLLSKGGNWLAYPRQMLTARVISEGVRTSLPGVVAGIYTPEEVEDMPPLKATVREEAPPAVLPPQQKQQPKHVSPQFEAYVNFARNAEEKGYRVRGEDGKIKEPLVRSVLTESQEIINGFEGKKDVLFNQPLDKFLVEFWVKSMELLLPFHHEEPGEEENFVDPFGGE